MLPMMDISASIDWSQGQGFARALAWVPSVFKNAL